MLTSSRLFSIFYTFIYDFPTPPRIANRNNAAPILISFLFLHTTPCMQANIYHVSVTEVRLLRVRSTCVSSTSSAYVRFTN